MQSDHKLFSSSVNVFAMPHAIDYHIGPFDLKQYAVIANAQAVFRGEIGQPLDVPSQIIL
jgi:hypothetical protein